MTFRETLRAILTRYEFRGGDPHIHLIDVLAIVHAKKNRTYPQVAGDHKKIRNIPFQFGLTENGLTPASILYQNVARLLQKVAPNAIHDVDEDRTIWIDSGVELSPSANLNKLTPEGCVAVGAMLYIAGIGDFIRSIDNYVDMEDVESGYKSLFQAQELLPNEKSTNEAVSLAEQIRQAASVEGKPANKSGCFIATAVYGDVFAPEVICLRQYRDAVLSVTKIGRAFIEIYYILSPSFAKILGHSRLLKAVTRETILNPIVTHIRDRYTIHK